MPGTKGGKMRRTRAVGMKDMMTTSQQQGSRVPMKRPAGTARHQLTRAYGLQARCARHAGMAGGSFTGLQRCKRCAALLPAVGMRIGPRSLSPQDASIRTIGHIKGISVCLRSVKLSGAQCEVHAGCQQV